MIAWFARNHVAANLLMITMLFLGLLSLRFKIPLEVFPTIDRDIVNIAVALPGSTPAETEEGIAVRVEEAIQDLEGVERITSRSMEGAALISVRIDPDYSARDLLADLKSRVDAINTFPATAEKPVIALSQRKREVITVAIYGDQTELEIRQRAERVRDDLLNLDGVTQVELDAVRPYEVAIEVSAASLRQYGLTLAQVSKAVSSSALDLSAGSILTTGGEILVRAKGQAYHRDQFEQIVVLAREDGTILKLRDLASVIDGFEETAMRTRFNGKTAAFVDIYRSGDQNAIEVADRVKEYIALQQPHLPHGMQITHWRDRSKIIKKRLKTLSDNAIQGGVLILLLLTLFLRPSVALWVFVGVPISFMGAFIVMPFFGVTLNIFSVFAFILVLGVVVDDAIVTGENVYAHLSKAENSLQAAIQGTREVAIPVTFGILTTIVAFLPIAFIEGLRGKLFAQVPVVVIPILLFSLIESKLVLPAHLKHIRFTDGDAGRGRLARFQRRFAEGFERAVLQIYKPALRRCLAHRYLFLATVGGAFLVILALVMSGWTRFVFFPRVQSEVARCTLTMPAGTPFEVTDKHVQRIAQAAAELQEKHRDPNNGESVVIDILAASGSAGGSAVSSSAGRVMFEIVPPEERDSEITSSDLVQEWRRLIGPIPGAESLTFRAEIGRVSDPIDIQFSGNDFATLSAVADQLKRELATYPTVFDISDSLSDGKQELRVELKSAAHSFGLTRAEIIGQIRDAFYGSQAQRIQRGRDDIRVMVRYPKAQRSAISQLLEMQIVTSDGRRIPLSQVADLTPGRSPTAITRIDRYRTVNVTADVDKQATNMVALQRQLERFTDELLVQYPGIHYAMEGEAKEQAESFASLAWGLVFVLFAIYSLLAIPFRSYSQPFIVISVIPLGLAGAVIGHWVMAMDLTLLSLLGMLALMGVVVNDSLVLVDFINKFGGRTSATVDQAILNAGVARFRPVLLTSLTTFIGLMPLLFEKSTQAQFLIPMAVSLGFGILFATLVTLFMIPVNYKVLQDFRGRTQGSSDLDTMRP